MFDPVKASKNIKNEFIDYVTTSNFFSDAKLQEQCIKKLNNTISKGPLLEIKDAFKQGKSIRELIDEGILSPLFEKLEAEKQNEKACPYKLPLDRKLYVHQEDAIRKITDGKNIVISTGTGSGKTNCFLIPILNELFREQEKGTMPSPGIRALFIYPMNALANDQLKNIREILMYYPDITFGVYNGGTENDEDKAIAVYEAMFANESNEKLRHRLKNEILSRDKMKETPPNILFTNYAMLEHLLFRPKDDVLFTNSNFRFIVLDEAHIYSGATGIETSLLLRRVRARMTSKSFTQYILTSATLGNGSDDDNDIVTFANNLCGVEFFPEDIVRASRESLSIEGDIIEPTSELLNELADEKNMLSDILQKHNIPFDANKTNNELLYDFLVKTKQYHLLRQNINGVCDVDELKDILELDLEGAMSFINLCSKAQRNGQILIDARYHFFIKCLEGCYIAFSDEKQIFLTRKKMYFDDDSESWQVFEIALCENCGKYAIVGKIEENKLVQVGNFEDEPEYFYFDDNAEIQIDDEELIDEGIIENNQSYSFCTKCGRVSMDGEEQKNRCSCGMKYVRKIKRAKKLKLGARCGNCCSGSYKRVYLGNDAATSVLATALYEELPEVEYVDTSSNEPTTITSNLFAKAALSKSKAIKRTGRQFLVFSDSRQEAAKFACYLSKSYNEFLRRRGICQVLNGKNTAIYKTSYEVNELISLLTNYFDNKKSFSKSNNDTSSLTVESRKNAWVAVLNELARYNSPTSLTSLGFLQFEYLGNGKEIIEAVAKLYKAKYEHVKSLLDLIIFEIVRTGAVFPEKDTDIDDNDREYIFYTPSQKYIKYVKAPNENNPHISSFAPKNKKGKLDEFYKTNKMQYVCRALSITETEAALFLEQYFNYLVQPSLGNSHCLVDINRNGAYVIKGSSFRIKTAKDETIKWFVCDKCGKVSQFNIDNKCLLSRCNGNQSVIDPNIISQNNHFANLYLNNRMSPLFIKEHTAQLSKQESAEYQQQFIKKEINALSCSTTFEMGVDVGDLETVFLRDVPPLPSNYAQRAGRAGRSINSAAFALTFAKLSSHDLTFFNNPKKMINGIIHPPLFKIDNEKIVLRHIYAVALSMFFAKNENYYNNNDCEKFINQKGYVNFINWIKEKPDDLKKMIQNSIPDSDNLHKRLGIDDFSWIESFSGNDGVFTQLINEYEVNIDSFNKLIKQYKKENDFKKAASCEQKMKNYMSNRLIDFLVRGNILPKYGFPVDTVELAQNMSNGQNSKISLTRDLQIAIGEYAPSAEVVANGRLYTSRYIKKSNVGKNNRDWKTGFIAVCDNAVCKTVNYSVVPPTKEGIKCISCGKKINQMSFFESIQPISGFITERKDKDVPLTKQEKKYRSEDYYIGNKAAKLFEKYSFLINNIKIEIESTTNDSLMVKSNSFFYVCPTCGYALANDEKTGDKNADADIKKGALKIETTKPHESLYYQNDCSCHNLIRRSLHCVFNTDVAKITFCSGPHNYNVMLSVLYAILNAISQELNVEKRDIKGCLSKKMLKDSPQYSLIIYDAVPGGAGHSRRLIRDKGKVFHQVLIAALNNLKACSCDPSCYNCLRSYENQRVHDLLDRNKAIEFLSNFQGEIEVLENINEDEQAA